MATPQSTSPPVSAAEITRRHYLVIEMALKAAARHGVTLSEEGEEPPLPAMEGDTTTAQQQEEGR
ncbi:MAG TPA: hypothetical protein VGD69_24885 [Herpetosiphonaceae bacterium]